MARQIAVTNPLAQRSTTAYDPAGRIQALIDPLGDRTTSVYDGAGQKVCTIDASGQRHTRRFAAPQAASTRRTSTPSASGRALPTTPRIAGSAARTRWAKSARRCTTTPTGRSPELTRSPTARPLATTPRVRGFGSWTPTTGRTRASATPQARTMAAERVGQSNVAGVRRGQPTRRSGGRQRRANDLHVRRGGPADATGRSAGSGDGTSASRSRQPDRSCA